MQKPALTIRVFGYYLLALSAALLVAPGVLLSPFGIPAPTDVWIRVTGMLVGFLGFYYVRAAAAELTPFFGWTIPVRLSVLVFFGAFVATGLAPPALLLFGIVDAAGAVWTWLAIKNMGNSPARA